MILPSLELPAIKRAKAQAAQQRSDTQTKPPGSLGQLETLAAQIAAIQDSAQPHADKALLAVFAADHGITAQGVSAWPSEVTAQMVHNFATGGAAVNVLANKLDIQLRVIDAGVAADLSTLEKITHHKIAPGTADFSLAAAMTSEQCLLAFSTGVELAHGYVAEGVDLIGFGDMGIGNTSSAAMLMSLLLGLPIEDCIGAGAGLDAQGIDHKTKILLGASQRVHEVLDGQDPKSPEGAAETLRQCGGLEIAMMSGAMLGAAQGRVPILVDGFIASSALLAAWRIQPAIREFCIFAHRSAEHGHRRLLQELEAEPLLDLGMRLGEGSGAAMAVPVVRAAVALLNDMATFDDAGVSGSEA